LYFDLNQIIHESIISKKNTNEITSRNEIAKKIFLNLDSIFQKIQPKKYCFIAVDGVTVKFFFLKFYYFFKKKK
jgi:5'-3' exonuclease